jgi:hypothetical protein
LVALAVRKIVATNFEFESVNSLLKYQALEQENILHNLCGKLLKKFINKQLNMSAKNFSYIFACKKYFRLQKQQYNKAIWTQIIKIKCPLYKLPAQKKIFFLHIVGNVMFQSTSWIIHLPAWF